MNSRKWKPFTLDVKSSGVPLEEEIPGSIRFRSDVLTADDQRLLFSIWFLSLFFPDVLPTRPIATMLGPKGSGKSITLRKVGQLLLGRAFDVTALSHDHRDFDAAVTHEFYVVIDNADTLPPWLEDRLAIAATGGTIKIRELYTNNRMLEYPIRAMIAITSRTPKFRREDVADRLLLFTLDALDEEIAESVLLERIQEKREAILVGVVQRLQQVVAILQKERGAEYKTKFRMADFGVFALKIAHAEGWYDRMAGILSRLTEQQASFALAEEELVFLIEEWLRDDDGRNIERAVKSRELWNDLRAIAERLDVKFEFVGNPRGFALKLGNLLPTLKQYFDIRIREGKAHQRFYAFRPFRQDDEQREF